MHSITNAHSNQRKHTPNRRPQLFHVFADFLPPTYSFPLCELDGYNDDLVTDTPLQYTCESQGRSRLTNHLPRPAAPRREAPVAVCAARSSCRWSQQRATLLSPPTDLPHRPPARRHHWVPAGLPEPKGLVPG